VRGFFFRDESDHPAVFFAATFLTAAFFTAGRAAGLAAFFTAALPFGECGRVLP